jgi:hypothetical protein
MQRAVVDVKTGQEEWRRERDRRNRAVTDLLGACEHEDPDEQRETVELLMRTLDVDRTATREQFPR